MIRLWGALGLFAVMAAACEAGVTPAYYADWTRLKEPKGFVSTLGQLQAAGCRSLHGHQQGISCNDDYVFFGASGAIGKLDWTGKPVKVRELKCHMGDVCWHKGRLYATWSYAEKGRRRNVIAVFDEDLKLLEEHPVEGLKGIDGITILDDVIYFGVGVGERTFHRENRIGRMTLDFKLLDYTTVDIGVEVNFGVQNLVAADGKVYGFFYTHVGDRPGSPITCGVFDRNLKLLETRQAYSGMGITVAPKRFQTVPGKTVFLVGGSSTPKPDSKPDFAWLHYDFRVFK